MPLNTDVTPAPPQVIVEVFDDTGGGPKSHVADVHVSWDPAFMKFLSASPAAKLVYTPGSGTLRWHKTNCPGGKKKKFVVKLQRKKAGPTWVIVSAHDPSKGQMKTKKYKVKAKFP
jgi:hypothetical protein